MNNISLNSNSSILIEELGLKFYFDPYEINIKNNDANYIFITHNHYDHLDEKSIKNIINNKTNIFCPNSIVLDVAKIVGSYDKIYVLKPNKTIVNRDDDGNIIFSVDTVPSYNIEKNFHKKEDGYLGYILNVNDTKYYIAGDTDITDENKKVKCDIALVPIGGTYTMNYEEASKLINIIKPKIAIPTHYGNVVGSVEDATNFKKLVNSDINVEIIM